MNEPTVCPFCKSTEVQSTGAICTLIGWFGSPDKDPNHFTECCTCRGCARMFYKHWVPASGVPWYVDRENHVLSGTPECCSRGCLIRCKCGGWKKHSTNGKSTGYNLVEGKSVAQQPMFWQCGECGERTEDLHQ